MLAIIGLSGGELILILIVLMFPVMATAVVLTVYFFVRKNKKGGAPTPPPVTPPVAQAPRKCPKCGSILKPDAPEGLCPACLLQHGIATEGGAPPGTPAFTPPPLLELAKLFPQLEILEIIGQGGMGAVYKARQPALDRFVALKILAPRSGGDLDFAGRFSREARALARLSHPNIVAVYDFGQVQRSRRREEADGGKEQANPPPHVGGYEGDLSHFIMEFVDGPNLRQVEQAGKLTPREALQIIPQICAALQFAHDEGIVHRDIKPENVLLDKKGRVKIADFGLAKILGQEADFRLTGARDVMGTPHYMAPEQVEKPQEVDHRADIYSLGVVFYEMLTGELPLGKFDPPSHKVQIDVRLDDVVLRSLANNPDRRYQQVGDVKTELESIAQTPPQFAARPANPAHQGAGNRSSSRWNWIGWLILAAAIIGVGIVLAFAAGLYFLRHTESRAAHFQPLPPPTAQPANVMATSGPTNPNDGVDFHCRVFDCDAVTVDALISTDKRHSVTNHFPDGIPALKAPAVFATIDTSTFAALLKSVRSPNQLLVDNHQTVSKEFHSVLLMGGPQDQLAGEGWRRHFLANGSLGMHHRGMDLQIKIDLNSVNYNLYPANPGAARPVSLTQHLYYEGYAPRDGVLVFLIFFTLPDRTDHYLIVSFETADWFTGKTDPNSGTADLERTDGERAFIRITQSNELSPITPDVRFLAVVPAGYVLKASTGNGGFSDCSNLGLDPDSYRAYFPGINQSRPFQPGQPAPRPRPITFDSPEQTAAERESLKSQLQALQDQGLIAIFAGQPKLLFSLTNGAGDVDQAFLKLVPAQTNSPFPPPLEPPPPVRPPSLPPPGNVIRPLRRLPSRQTNLNSFTQGNDTITPEEQTALIEIERVRMLETNPIARILPPAEFSAPTNSTNRASSTKIDPQTGMPVAGTNRP
jgi:serine/threonine protein kinase